MTPKICASVKDAAESLGVSAWTVRQWIASGDLPTVKFPSVKYAGERGKRILILVDDLKAFAEKRRTVEP